MISLEALRARQPQSLLRTDVFRSVPPEDITPIDLADLASNEVVVDPAKVLKIYRRHVSTDIDPEPSVLIRAFTQLGFLFDPNSFFSVADRQLLTSHRHFKALAWDLAHVRTKIPDAAAPVLLYSMSCLEYRCAPLLPTLLDAVERNMPFWRTEVLSMVLHSIASLGLCSDRLPTTFDLEDGSRSRDYSHLGAKIVEELADRLGDSAAQAGDDDVLPEMSLQDYSRAAFAVAMAGLYDAPRGRPVLPMLLAGACRQIQGSEDLDSSGWAQFFLYQTLYCADVEKPASEEAIKRAIPMWIQERLHHRWLDSVVVHAQPQGADQMQRDVDAALRRTNTQALLNCSCGREWDEQHCWFAGFLLEPKVSLECDSMLPLGPGRPRPSGWLAMKSRVLRSIGYKVVTIHRCFWDKLTEDQKDEQLLRIRTEVGYVHDREMERRQRKIRQTPHTYKGIESKKKEWAPLPPPPSE